MYLFTTCSGQSVWQAPDHCSTQKLGFAIKLSQITDKTEAMVVKYIHFLVPVGFKVEMQN